MTKRRDDMDLMQARVADIHGALFGDAEHPDRPGLFERVRLVESYIGRVNRLIWLSLGALVASGITLAVSWLR